MLRQNVEKKAVSLPSGVRSFLLELFTVLIMILALLPTRGHAAEFEVIGASATLEENVYQLTARIDFHFSDRALEALGKGVPLTIVLEIEVAKMRSLYFLDWEEKAATLTQRYQLQYHALSKQYLVTNLNSGSQYSLPDRESAFLVLGSIVNLPLLDQKLLKPEAKYSVRLRALLDIETLPVPLRLLAYVTPGWYMSSEWYSWPLQP